MKTPLLYSLHSGMMFGTERMALATAHGLCDEFQPVIIAPAGPVHAEAKRLGFDSIEFTTPSRYAADLRPYFARHQRLAAMGTRVLHTLVCAMWNRVYNRRCANLQVVHGGASEVLSYGRKKWLHRMSAHQVAVSGFVKDRLVANGSRPDSITVIENFLTAERVDTAPARAPFRTDGLRRVLVVSRLEPLKRVDLLLDALDLEPSLNQLEVRVLGTGGEERLLRARAESRNPNVQFLGYRNNVAEEMANSDLFLHLCPEEPFGLVLLEAMAAGLPVLAPNRGGAGSIVENDRSGFHFRANDAWCLAEKLTELREAPAARINNVVAEGHRALRTRFSPGCGVSQYRRLIEERLK